MPADGSAETSPSRVKVSETSGFLTACARPLGSPSVIVSVDLVPAGAVPAEIVCDTELALVYVLRLGAAES